MCAPSGTWGSQWPQLATRAQFTRLKDPTLAMWSGLSNGLERIPRARIWVCANLPLLVSCRSLSAHPHLEIQIAGAVENLTTKPRYPLKVPENQPSETVPAFRIPSIEGDVGV
jgi:hypothetical protein